MKTRNVTYVTYCYVSTHIDVLQLTKNATYYLEGMSTPHKWIRYGKDAFTTLKNACRLMTEAEIEYYGFEDIDDRGC